MNCFVGDEFDEPDRGTYGSLNRIRRPPLSELFVFIDVHEDSLAGIDFIAVPHKDYGMVVELPSSRHLRAGPLTFADGHGVIRRWRDARTCRKVTGEHTSVGNAGRTDNNPDILWLYRHATCRSP